MDLIQEISEYLQKRGRTGCRGSAQGLFRRCL